MSDIVYTITYVNSVHALIDEMRRGREMACLIDAAGNPVWHLSGAEPPNRVTAYAANAAIKRGIVVKTIQGCYVLADPATQ